VKSVTSSEWEAASAGNKLHAVAVQGERVQVGPETAREPFSGGPGTLVSALGLAWESARLHRPGAPPLKDRAEQAAWLQRCCQLLCTMHRFDVRVTGPEPPAASVIVANHLGYIDPLVICALHPCSPIAKSEVSDWLYIGAMTRRLNVLFVRRDDVHSRARTLLRAYRNIKAGVSVLNFPEGTTTRLALLPFQRGAFWLARRTGRPLVPLVMYFDDPDLCWVDQEGLLPHYVKLWSRKNRTLHIQYLPPIDPRAFPSPDALLEVTRSAIKNVLDYGSRQAP
jgi:1-acyl-sn-glycerol-3-phosphate acyltransferase